MHSSQASAASIETARSLRSSARASACSTGSVGAGIAPSSTETGPKLVGHWLPLDAALDRIASITNAPRQTVEELVRPIVQALMDQADMVARSQEIVSLLDAATMAEEDCSEAEMEVVYGLLRLKTELAEQMRR